jgi:quercetin dioxygenase-like cupin family protein
MEIHPALRGATWASDVPPLVHGEAGPPRLRIVSGRLGAAELAGVACSLAVRRDLWQPLVRHHPHQRWYERVAHTEDVELWLIGWWPGQSTPLHDHGGAEGALVVVAGSLEETVVAPVPEGAPRRRLRPETVVLLPASTVHRVGNAGRVPATSIHAYSPPGCQMREVDERAAVVAAGSTVGVAGAGVASPEWRGGRPG